MTQDHGTHVLRPTPDEDVPADVHDRVLDTLREGMAEPVHRRARPPWVLAVAAAAAVAVLAGGAVGVTRLVADSPPEVAAPQLPTTQVTAPATTAAPTTAPPTSALPTTTTAPATTTPDRPAALVGFGDVMYEQAWAVYASYGSNSFNAAGLVDAEASLTALGYDVTPRSVSCDYDSRLALNLRSDKPIDTVVGLYFATRAEADAFTAGYDGAVEGVVPVVNLCEPGAAVPPDELTPAAGFPAQDVGPYDPAATYQGVFLQVVPIADQGDGSAAVTLRTELGALGFYAGRTDIGCPSALGLDPGGQYLGVPLLFDSVAAQQQFVSAYRGEVSATAAVPGSCVTSYSPIQPYS